MDTSEPLDTAMSTDGPLPKQRSPPEPPQQAQVEELSRFRCDPDPFHPGLAVCTAQIDDDRQGISHFFGRNKRATASIPQECFPLMCRVHYQEKGYRWGKRRPGALADFQCGCIVRTLENMAAITFTDEDGAIWPWFCGLTLQIPTPKTKKAIKSTTIKSKKAQVGQAGSSNVNPEESSNPISDQSEIPEWLRKLATKSESDNRYTATDNSNGVRYTINQVIYIVRAIGKWCLENNTKLPKIEAIPTTLGMHFEQELDEAKKEVKALTIQKDRAASDLRTVTTISANNKARAAFKLAGDRLRDAKEELARAEKDFEETAHMVPATRKAKNGVSTGDTKIDESTLVVDRKGKGKELVVESDQEIAMPDRKGKGKGTAVSPEREYVGSIDADDERDETGFEDGESLTELVGEIDNLDTSRERVRRVATNSLTCIVDVDSILPSSDMASTFFFGEKRGFEVVDDEQDAGGPSKRIKR